MPITGPIGFDVDHLREQVRVMYGRLATAPEEKELMDLASSVGLKASKVERFDCFAGTTAGARVARDLDVHAVSVIARPEGG